MTIPQIIALVLFAGWLALTFYANLRHNIRMERLRQESLELTGRLTDLVVHQISLIQISRLEKLRDNPDAEEYPDEPYELGDILDKEIEQMRDAARRKNK